MINGRDLDNFITGHDGENQLDQDETQAIIDHLESYGDDDGDPYRDDDPEAGPIFYPDDDEDMTCPHCGRFTEGEDVPDGSIICDRCGGILGDTWGEDEED